MIQKITILFALLLTLCSCLNEGGEGNCVKENRIHLAFKYTLNTSGEDKFDEVVGAVNLYVFDQSSCLLVRIVKIAKDEIVDGVYSTAIDPGIYSLLAWGTSGEYGETSDYKVGEDGGEARFSPSVEVGRTTLENFRLSLLTKEGLGCLVPQNGNFSHLFHAVAKSVVITKDGQTVDLSFTKNTNTVKTKVEGVHHLPEVEGYETPYLLFITGTDDFYDYDNIASKNSRVLRYDGAVSAPDEKTLLSDILIQRIDMSRHKQSPLLLHFEQADGIEVMPPMNLLDIILKLRDEDGNLVFNTQEDIDRCDEYSFVFKIGIDLNVTVSVEGFEIVDVDPL